MGAPSAWCTGTLHDLLPDGTVITGFSLCGAGLQPNASISGFQAKASLLSSSNLSIDTRSGKLWIHESHGWLMGFLVCDKHLCGSQIMLPLYQQSCC